MSPARLASGSKSWPSKPAMRFSRPSVSRLSSASCGGKGSRGRVRGRVESRGRQTLRKRLGAGEQRAQAARRRSPAARRARPTAPTPAPPCCRALGAGATQRSAPPLRGPHDSAAGGSCGERRQSSGAAAAAGGGCGAGGSRNRLAPPIACLTSVQAPAAVAGQQEAQGLTAQVGRPHRSALWPCGCAARSGTLSRSSCAPPARCAAIRAPSSGGAWRPSFRRGWPLKGAPRQAGRERARSVEAAQQMWGAPAALPPVG